MRYIIKIHSQEEESFSMLLQISAKATFLELHNLIVQSCSYDPSQMASFFILNTKGQRAQEISLMELSSEGAELNIAVMDVATLEEFIDREMSVLEYQYDFFGDRYFSLEVEEIQEGEQAKAVVIHQKGEIPEQIKLEGFEGVDFFSKGIEKEAPIDYEKYLSSFDDCNEGDIDYQSLDDLEDENF